MADPLTIKTSTRKINGITTRIEVNVETGAATLYQDNGLAGRTAIATASSIGNKWTVTNNFAPLYSTRVGRTLSTAEAQTFFEKDFQTLSNNDRASIINTWSPPNSKTYFATTAKIPGVIDPVTGVKTGQTTQTQPLTPAATPPAAPPGAPGSTAGGSNPIDFNDQTLYSTDNENFRGFKDISPQKTYSSIMKYPLEESAGYDYLKVSLLKYSRQGLGKSLGSPLGNVFLPMQPNISDSNGVSWNEDRMNPIQSLAGTAAYNAISRAAQANNLNAIPGLISSLGSDLMSVVKDVTKTPGLDKFIAGYFANQAVGANVFGRATGSVVNNNLELLFDGPKLRTFRYNFRFTPRSGAEAEMIKRIIRFFKEEMAPKQTEGYLFLNSPNVFKLEYIYGETGKQHPFLNVIKPCALTDFSVNYTPDGTYMTYEGDSSGNGSMTSYTVDMQFSELDPIYKKDQQEAGGTGY